MWRVRLTRRALRDIEEIHGYSTERWGLDVATGYVAGIERALSDLETDPSLLRREADWSTHLRFLAVRKHVLVCDVIGTTIFVLAVPHGSMDIVAKLEGLEPRLRDESRSRHDETD